MKLISLNIECNFHLDLVLPFLKLEKPDVICLQEVLEADFPNIKKELGLEGVFQAFDYVRSSHYPTIQGQKVGLAIFAKEIKNSGYIFYAGKESNLDESFDKYKSDETIYRNKALLWIETMNERGILHKVVNIHLPVTKEGAVTPYQLETCDKLMEKLKNLGEFVLCGDTNAPRGKEAFAKISSVYKDNIPTEYQTSIDQNLHKVKGIQFMVDGLFTTVSYTATNVKLVDGVSDHMAIVANIEKD
jgi:exonuclease III